MFSFTSTYLKQLLLGLFLFIGIYQGFSQTDSSKIYNPKAEIYYDNKRYRVYNNWLSFGGGGCYSTHWPKDQRNAGADYSFHVKQHYFRLGGYLNGNELHSYNNLSAHLAYGLRKETIKYNLAAFAGVSTSYFRRPISDTASYDLNNVYNAAGAYACLEAVYKIKYDVGIGGQIFCDYNQVQTVYGVRLILYFSGAYRGIKYGYGNKKK